MTSARKHIILLIISSFIALMTLALILDYFAIFTISKQLYFYLLVAMISCVIIIITLILFWCRQTTSVKQQTNYNIDYGSLINSFSDGIFIIDEKNIIHFFNKEAQKITGFKAEDVLNLAYSSVFQIVNQKGELINVDNDPIIISRRTGESQRVEMLYIKSYSGKTIPISANICMPDDSSDFLIVAFRDISAELDKERDQLEFISTASHEMRTPIAAIDGYLGLALNPTISTIDEKAREYITKAQNSSKHLGELFKNLLNISKAEDKRLATNLQPVDLIKLISDTCNDFRKSAADKNIALIFEQTDSKERQILPEIFVYADQSLLREALSNLIENAIKYTTNGSVKINALMSGHDKAIISVVDTGMGIAPEDIPHLFQKFYRVDNSQTREIGGTGLGLYLTRSIVENMNGRIWAESRVGFGSSFFIELRRLDKNQRDQLQQTINAIPTSTVS